MRKTTFSLLFAFTTGALLGQSRISTASNQVSVELPAGFAHPPAEVLAKVYPNGTHSDMYRNPPIDGTIIFDVASTSATKSYLPIIKATDEKNLAQDHRPIRWIANEVTTFQGKPCLHYDYVRTTATGPMRHRAYYVLNNSTLIFFQFSIPERSAAQAQDSLEKSIASIRFSR